MEVYRGTKKFRKAVVASLLVLGDAKAKIHLGMLGRQTYDLTLHTGDLVLVHAQHTGFRLSSICTDASLAGLAWFEHWHVPLQKLPQGQMQLWEHEYAASLCVNNAV